MFPPADAVSCLRKVRVIYLLHKTPKKNNFFNALEITKNQNFGKKTHFVDFALFVGDFSKRHHCNLKFPRKFCSCYS